MANPLKPLASTASLTLDWTKHGDTTVVMNKADGWVVSLPAATGSGVKFRVYVGTTITSGVGRINANGTDIIQGGVSVSTDAGGVSVLAGATADYITMNGSTTGGVKGSWVDLTDVASGEWLCGGFLVSTGVEATPFAAT